MFPANRRDLARVALFTFAISITWLAWRNLTSARHERDFSKKCGKKKRRTRGTGMWKMKRACDFSSTKAHCSRVHGAFEPANDRAPGWRNEAGLASNILHGPDSAREKGGTKFTRENILLIKPWQMKLLAWKIESRILELKDEEWNVKKHFMWSGFCSC